MVSYLCDSEHVHTIWISERGSEFQNGTELVRAVTTCLHVKVFPDCGSAAKRQTVNAFTSILFGTKNKDYKTSKYYW